MTQATETLAEAEPIIKACYQLATDIAPRLCDIAFLRILQGCLSEG